MRRHIAASLLCMSAAACGGDNSPAAPTAAFPTFVLTGTVTDRSNGQALPGATVVVVNERLATTTVITDANGRYSVGGLPPRGYTAYASKQYYQRESRGVTLTTNATQDFALDFLQPFTRSGIGDAAFDFLTLDRQQVRIQGQYTGNSSPFVVSIDNEALVDELLGASHDNTAFEGTFTIGAGTVAIEKSPGVAWSFTEVR